MNTNYPTWIEEVKAATPGPWKIGYNDGSGKYDENNSTFCLSGANDDYVAHAELCDNEGDAILIAHAPTDLTRAIFEIEEREKETKRQHEIISRLHGEKAAQSMDFVKVVKLLDDAKVQLSDRDKAIAELTAMVKEDADDYCAKIDHLESILRDRDKAVVGLEAKYDAAMILADNHAQGRLNNAERITHLESVNEGLEAEKSGHKPGWHCNCFERVKNLESVNAKYREALELIAGPSEFQCAIGESNCQAAARAALSEETK